MRLSEAEGAEGEGFDIPPALHGIHEYAFIRLDPFPPQHHQQIVGDFGPSHLLYVVRQRLGELVENHRIELGSDSAGF